LVFSLLSFSFVPRFLFPCCPPGFFPSLFLAWVPGYGRQNASFMLSPASDISLVDALWSSPFFPALRRVHAFFFRCVYRPVSSKSPPMRFPQWQALQLPRLQSLPLFFLPTLIREVEITTLLPSFRPRMFFPGGVCFSPLRVRGQVFCFRESSPFFSWSLPSRCAFFFWHFPHFFSLDWISISIGSGVVVISLPL